MKKPFISVIVPAYNEDKTVEDIIKALIASKHIDEIICVNDGSTDKTEEILEKYKQTITVINLRENKGKGNALAVGIKQAKGDIVVFLDADLISLSDKHVKALITPLLNKEYKAVMGYMVDKTGVSIFKEITGQRAYFKKDLLPYLDEISETRFGVEMFLNGLFENKDTKKFILRDLQSLQKFQKQTPDVAVKEYIKEGIEILKVIGNTEIFSEEDLKPIFEHLLPYTTLKELRKYIAESKNKKIKESLEEYIKKYLGLTK